MVAPQPIKQAADCSNLVIYFLTDDLSNEKEQNELRFLSQVARLVVVTVSTQKKNALGLKQITVRANPFLLRVQRIWTRACLLLARLANSQSDREFPTRNLYLGNVAVRFLVNQLWRLKQLPWANALLPSYDVAYFAPVILAQRLASSPIRRRKGRTARLVIHNSLLLHLGSLAPFVASMRAAGIKTIGNVKSWDNPFYSQFATRADGYFVWSESMWRDIRATQNVRSSFHYAWGARPFYKLLDGLESGNYQAPKQPASDEERLVIGYAAAFCDEYMGRYEVSLVKEIARQLALLCPRWKILFRPYPILPESFYAELAECPNIGIVPIKGPAVDRFGDGREFIRFGSDEERFAYLAECHGFLSLGTSFTIEAAIAGLPIVQLYLESDRRTTEAEREIFERFDISDHLHNYFLETLPVAHSISELARALTHEIRGASTGGQQLLARLGVPRPGEERINPTAELQAALLQFATTDFWLS